MADVYNWHSKEWSDSNCAGTFNDPGWYIQGTYEKLADTYINPATGKPYTFADFEGTASGGTTASPTSTDYSNYPTSGYGIDTNTTAGGIPTYQQWFMQQQQSGAYPDGAAAYLSGGGDPVADYYAWASGQGASMPSTGSEHPVANSAGTPTATQPGQSGMPVFGEGAGANIPTPTVDAAPAYKISAEQQEMQDLYGDKLTDWVEAGGYGLSPEVQAQMIQLQTDTLKATEAENLRVMTNNMEARGITNSGYLDANTNMIKANTTKALASAISNVQIQSALMKMESFETDMAAMNNFLGYLSEQSQLQYAPEFATWQAEQAAKLQGWQAQMDVYKLELQQAYQTQNMQLEAQLQSQLNTEQHQFNIELAEMEIEANQQAATASGIGSIFGTILGFIFGK